MFGVECSVLIIRILVINDSIPSYSLVASTLCTSAQLIPRPRPVQHIPSINSSSRIELRMVQDRGSS